MGVASKAKNHLWINMMSNLNDMALFVEVVRAKGFRRAAEALEMPNSTLSRRITALEKEIGLRLLHRTTRRIELTEAGQIYFERCQRIVEEARLAHEQLDEMLEQPTGVLRASLPVDFATTYLAPIIAEFSKLHPGISFEFDLTPRNVDLVADPFDIAIRMRSQPDSHLIARPIAQLIPNIYASPGYLDLHGEPKQPSDLIGHQCLDFPKTTHWHLVRGTESMAVPIHGPVRLNSPGMARRLAALDLGLVLLPEELVADELRDGRLRRVLADWHGLSAPVYALTETKLLPAKTQRFLNFLQERLRQ